MVRHLGTLRGRLTVEEEAQIVALAARRLNAGQIAQRLDRHPGTVNFAMYRLGVKAPSQRRFAYSRNGSPVMSFTPIEDHRIEQLRVEGLNPRQIADQLATEFDHRRTGATIRVRLLMLANADAAHG